jgi:hypothetical protein
MDQDDDKVEKMVSMADIRAMFHAFQKEAVDKKELAVDGAPVACPFTKEEMKADGRVEPTNVILF